MNSTMQRDVMEWFSDWVKVPVSKDTMLSFTRGPIRDFQMNFLLPKVRTNAYIDTIRANFYLQDEADSEDFIKEEINEALFADKLNKLKDLEVELSIHTAKVEEKRSTLHRKDYDHIQTKPTGLCSKQKELCCLLDHRIAKTRDMIQECDKLTVEGSKASNKLDGNSDKNLMETGKRLESLNNAAHNAFQLVVMRHYLSDGIFPLPISPKLGSSSSEEFNSLVLQVIHEDSCGPKISDWAHTERLSHAKICGDQARTFTLQEQASGRGLQQSMEDKMNALVVSWSTTHVTANHKNKSRKRLLDEAQDSLKLARESCRNNPNIGYRLSDFISLLRCRELIAKITRVRQHANKSMAPIETVFKNVSTDYFGSPGVADNLSICLDFGQGSKVRPWINAISDQEHIQEIYAVLQKTWKCVKRNLNEMVDHAKLPNNELLPNLLQTSECIQFTIPKMPSLIAAVQHQQQGHAGSTTMGVSDFSHHSVLSASTTSVVSGAHNFSRLDTTGLSVVSGGSGGSHSFYSEHAYEGHWYHNSNEKEAGDYAWGDEQHHDEIYNLISMQSSISTDGTALIADTSFERKIDEMQNFLAKYKA